MIVKIEPYANGGHANQSTTPATIPEGWAIVPEDIVIPATFPFVDIIAKNGIVISMKEGIIPDPESRSDQTLTLAERVEALETENASLRKQIEEQDKILKELIGTRWT